MKKLSSFATASRLVAQRLKSLGHKLTLGGEPSYVPIEPDGPEWSFTALGPTKLRYAHALADALIRDSLPGRGRLLLARQMLPRRGQPALGAADSSGTATAPRCRAPRSMRHDADPGTPDLEVISAEILRRLKLPGTWHRALEPVQKRTPHLGAAARSRRPPLAFAALARHARKAVHLLNAEGPAGLAPAAESRAGRRHSPRARPGDEAGRLAHFFPATAAARLSAPAPGSLRSAAEGVTRAAVSLKVTCPATSANTWSKLGITADPGVLEINLPPCTNAQEYAHWMEMLERSSTAVGLRSFKQPSPEETLGTGGGSHLLFGGPSFEEHPLFHRTPLDRLAAALLAASPCAVVPFHGQLCRPLFAGAAAR